MSAKDQSLDAFLSDLASSLPSPGGGGAAALCGALAAGLASMVVALSIGKKQCAAHEAKLSGLGIRAEAASLPKDTPERAEILESCLRQAASAPKKIADACCAVIELAEGCAACGSRLVLSDAATAAALAGGALRGAVINVKVNTALMRDREYAESLSAELEEKEREYAVRADAVCNAVAAALGF